MSYQVLALKYRPQTFEEVIGQSHVTITLSNAISTDRVAHAMLFTGPRGTGKTTIARILSKALNCETGPTITPCNQCKICLDIISGHCTDVFEIDGASNNSVDQIRDLRENVTYMPAAARYKIYIIDEVHMLSTAAFNALLKTLEEPPEHVLFIFATTEVHKIPATILSRCQRHDLGRIDLCAIADHLESLGKAEGFELEQRTLDLVAQEADGSIRDSLSLFDRILSASPDRKVCHDQVLEILGILDQQVLQDVSTAIVNKDGARLIDLIEQVSDSGLDLKRFYSDLITHFRNANIIKQCGVNSAAANITDSQKKWLNEFITRLSTGYLTDILNTLLNEESLVRYSSHTRYVIEMILLKLLDLNPDAQIDRLIEKLDHLAVQMRDNVSVQCASPNSKTTTTDKKKTPTAPLKANEPPRQPPQAQADIDTKTPSRAAPPVHAAGPASWIEFLGQLEQSHPFEHTLISKGRVIEENHRIQVELSGCSSFHVNRLEGKKDELSVECKKVLNKTLDIVILSESRPVKHDREKREMQRARQAAFNHPLVVEAKRIFNGEIINP